MFGSLDEFGNTLWGGENFVLVIPRLQQGYDTYERSVLNDSADVPLPKSLATRIVSLPW